MLEALPLPFFGALGPSSTPDDRRPLRLLQGALPALLLPCRAPAVAPALQAAPSNLMATHGDGVERQSSCTRRPALPRCHSSAASAAASPSAFGREQEEDEEGGE